MGEVNTSRINWLHQPLYGQLHNSSAISSSPPVQLKINCHLGNPGPDAYNPHKPPDPESSKEATFQFASKTPMSHQKALKKEAADPGPGAYVIDQWKEVAGKENGKFGSSSNRCGWARQAFQQPFTDPYNWSVD